MPSPNTFTAPRKTMVKIQSSSYDVLAEPTPHPIHLQKAETSAQRGSPHTPLYLRRYHQAMFMKLSHKNRNSMRDQTSNSAAVAPILIIMSRFLLLLLNRIHSPPTAEHQYDAERARLPSFPFLYLCQTSQRSQGDGAYLPSRNSQPKLR